ncbi:MAG: biotin/lipoyl-containing protein [Candidatus Kariarchaeum pelagius]
MQNAIVAENGGKITEIFIKQGDNVSTNQDLIKIKNEG